MPSRQSSRSQPTLATHPPRGRSPLRALLRLVALLVFLATAAYLAHAVWNAVQYFQTPPAYANFGLVPSMVALPGLGLSVDTELVIGVAMLVLFIGSLTLVLATRPRRELAATSAPTGAMSAMPPEPPAESPGTPKTPADDAPPPGEYHGLPLLPHMLIPTLPPEEAALLVPPADTPPDDVSAHDIREDPADENL